MTPTKPPSALRRTPFRLPQLPACVFQTDQGAAAGQRLTVSQAPRRTRATCAVSIFSRANTLTFCKQGGTFTFSAKIDAETDVCASSLGSGLAMFIKADFSTAEPVISQLNSDCILVEKGVLTKKLEASEINTVEKARDLLSLHN